MGKYVQAVKSHVLASVAIVDDRGCTIGQRLLEWSAETAEHSAHIPWKPLAVNDERSLKSSRCVLGRGLGVQVQKLSGLLGDLDVFTPFAIANLEHFLHHRYGVHD